MSEVLTPDALHIEARRYADERKAAGAVFDKKHLRFNDIVDVGFFFADCGAIPSLELAISGVREAVDACVIGDPQYIKGRGPLSMMQPWMRPTI